jgi:poly(3-hydroxybutyrate) depolymerase
MRAALRALACVLAVACGCASGEAALDERGPTGAAASADAGADASAGCADASRPALRGERRHVASGSDDRSYVIDAPASDPRDPRPLVLAFHGFRGDAENQRAGTGMDTLAEREHAIVVCPDGHEGVRLLGAIGRGWDLETHETRDLDFVRTLLDTLERERCVDRRRVYATGMSNGGFFANLVGCRMADRIAAIAPVAGGMPLPVCVPARPVAVLLTFGRADDVVSPSLMRAARDWWAQVNGCQRRAEHDGCTRFDGCRAELVSCEGPQAHTWPAGTTDRIWRFFATHPRG